MKKLTTVLVTVAGLAAYADRTANQGWVAEQITNAVQAVEEGYKAGDVLLGGRIDSEQTARNGADTVMQAALQQIAKDTTNLTQQVQNNLNNEAALRNQAIQAEAGIRGTADNTINLRIDTLTNLVNLIDGRVTQESQSRQASVQTLQNSVTDEVNNRIAAINQVQQDMTNKVNQAIVNHDFVVSEWENSNGRILYTEHPVLVTLTSGAEISCSENWPNGKPVYLRVVPNGDYSVDAAIHYLGYGSWPTTPYHATIWYANGQYMLNVLYVEEN